MTQRNSADGIAVVTVYRRRDVTDATLYLDVAGNLTLPVWRRGLPYTELISIQVIDDSSEEVRVRLLTLPEPDSEAVFLRLTGSRP